MAGYMAAGTARKCERRMDRRKETPLFGRNPYIYIDEMRCKGVCATFQTPEHIGEENLPSLAIMYLHKMGKLRR